LKLQQQLKAPEQLLDRGLANNLATKGYALIDSFLSEEMTLEIREYIDRLRISEYLKKAGIGTAHLHQVDNRVRGDYIRWISRESKIDAIRHYQNQLQFLVQYLNRYCFLGIKDYEMHTTYYPVGTHYEKHIDQLQVNGKRVISFILYLNDDWQTEDGGEIRVYPLDGSDHEDLAPHNGRLVMMLSNETPHEVLTVNKPRYSVTGWMLNQFVDTTFVGA
jgi:SM-20-related protein